jgi:hypothetical protein
MADANSPESKKIEALYGSGLMLQLAATDGSIAYAMGSDPNAGIRQLIDQVKAGSSGKTPAEAQNALQLVPGGDKGNLFATINITRVMQIIAAMDSTPAPQTPMTSQSNIVLTGTCGDGKTVIELAVPKQHATEVMGVVMQMQMQQMQQQQQQKQPQQSGGSTL